MAAKLLEKVYVGLVSGETVEKKSWFPEADALSFRGEGKEFLRVTVEDINALPEDIRTRALTFHAVSQKAGDGAVKPAGQEKRAEYEADPGSYIEDRVCAVWENMQGNIWIERAEGAGERVTLLAAALAEAGGIDLAQAQGIVSTWDASQKKVNAAVPEMAAALDTVKERRRVAKRAKLDEAVAASDGGDLLALLG